MEQAAGRKHAGSLEKARFSRGKTQKARSEERAFR
jgi:hypothetical protein